MVQGQRVLSPASRAGLRFACRALLLMLALHGAIYFPYHPSSWPARTLQAYLAWLTRAAAYIIRLGDSSVRVAGETVIEGGFPMQIVLDCTAIDAQALYVSVVLAFPAPARAKLLGALAGVVALGIVNLARIVTLYYVGLHLPERFDLMHEEVMLLVIVGSTGLAFGGWLLWVRRAVPSLSP